LPASTITQTDLANTRGNTAASQVTDAAMTGTVTYDYIPAPLVPEPSTLAFLGVGLVGLLEYMRRPVSILTASGMTSTGSVPAKNRPF
jgi:hypothetical protein